MVALALASASASAGQEWVVIIMFCHWLGVNVVGVTSLPEDAKRRYHYQYNSNCHIEWSSLASANSNIGTSVAGE